MRRVEWSRPTSRSSEGDERIGEIREDMQLSMDEGAGRVSHAARAWPSSPSDWTSFRERFEQGEALRLEPHVQHGAHGRARARFHARAAPRPSSPRRWPARSRAVPTRGATSRTATTRRSSSTRSPTRPTARPGSSTAMCASANSSHRHGATEIARQEDHHPRRPASTPTRTRSRACSRTRFRSPTTAWWCSTRSTTSSRTSTAASATAGRAGWASAGAAG